MPTSIRPQFKPANTHCLVPYACSRSLRVKRYLCCCQRVTVPDVQKFILLLKANARCHFIEVSQKKIVLSAAAMLSSDKLQITLPFPSYLTLLPTVLQVAESYKLPLSRPFSDRRQHFNPFSPLCRIRFIATITHLIIHSEALVRSTNTVFIPEGCIQQQLNPRWRVEEL